MIVKRSEVDDIIKILKLDDDIITKVFPCKIGEWVQFLIQNINNPRFLMISILDNDKIIGYLVAFNNVNAPISNCISVLYSKTSGLECNKEVLKILVEWSKEKGAASIDFVTNNVVGHTVYGFKKKATLMTRKL